MMVGQASAFQPNYNKAVIAAGRIFKLLDRKPLIDSKAGPDSSGLRLVCNEKKTLLKGLLYRYKVVSIVRLGTKYANTIYVGYCGW